MKLPSTSSSKRARFERSASLPHRRGSRVAIVGLLSLVMLGCEDDATSRFGSIEVLAAAPPARVSGTTASASAGPEFNATCGAFLDEAVPDLIVNAAGPIVLRADAGSPVAVAVKVEDELRCGVLREHAELDVAIAGRAQVWVISPGSEVPFDLSIGPRGAETPTVEAPPAENMVSVTSAPAGRDVVLEDGRVVGQTPLMFAWQGEGEEVSLSVDFGAGTRVAVRGVLVNGEVNLHADEPPASGYTVVAQTQALLPLPPDMDVDATMFIGRPCAITGARIDMGATHEDPALMRATLVAPDGTRVPLHQYQSGQNGGVNKRLNSADNPELDALRGVSAQGAWTVEANAGARHGTLNGVTLSLDCVAPGMPIGAAPPSADDVQVATATMTNRPRRSGRRARPRRVQHSGYQIVQAYPRSASQRRRMAARLRAQARRNQRNRASKPIPGAARRAVIPARRGQGQELVNPWNN